MGKIRLSDSEKKLLLLLLAILLFVGSYFIGFRRSTAAAEAIEAENAKNRQLIGQLENMVNRQEEVQEETKAAAQAVEDIKAKYPSDMTVEKAVAVVQEMEDATGVEVADISFVMNNLVMAFSEVAQQPDPDPAAAAAAAAAGQTEPQAAEQTEGQAGTPQEGQPAGYYAALTMNYQAGYENLKKMAEYVRGMQDRATIPTISAAYDSETGRLTGTMTLNLYYLTETGREYEPPQFPGIGAGVSDIFKSGAGSVVSNDSQESGSENDQGETDDGTEADAETEPQ